MRKRLPGYSISLDKKKQYSQSRLQIAPVGLAIAWNATGAPGMVSIGAARFDVGDTRHPSPQSPDRGRLRAEGGAPGHGRAPTVDWSSNRWRVRGGATHGSLAGCRPPCIPATMHFP